MHQFAVRLGDLQFRRTRLDHRLEHDLAHHLGGLRHPVPEHPRDGDQLLAGETHIDEHLRARRGLRVRTQMNRRVGIVDPRQTECPLHRLEQFQVDAGVLADLPRRHVHAVVTDDAARRHQHRRELCPDVLDGEPVAEQPLDQLGPFGPCLPFETVEQARSLDGFDTRVVGHRLNVYLLS